MQSGMLPWYRSRVSFALQSISSVRASSLRRDLSCGALQAVLTSELRRAFLRMRSRSDFSSGALWDSATVVLKTLHEISFVRAPTYAYLPQFKSVPAVHFPYQKVLSRASRGIDSSLLLPQRASFLVRFMNSTSLRVLRSS